MKELIGWSLILSPFIGIFVFVSITESFLEACGIFAATAAICGLIIAGASLIS